MSPMQPRLHSLAWATAPSSHSARHGPRSRGGKTQQSPRTALRGHPRRAGGSGGAGSGRAPRPSWSCCSECACWWTARSGLGSGCRDRRGDSRSGASASGLGTEGPLPRGGAQASDRVAHKCQPSHVFLEGDEKSNAFLKRSLSDNHVWPPATAQGRACLPAQSGCVGVTHANPSESTLTRSPLWQGSSPRKPALLPSSPLAGQVGMGPPCSRSSPSHDT